MMRVETYEQIEAVQEALLDTLRSRCPKMQWEAQVEDSDALMISATANLNGYVKSWQWYYELHLPVTVKMIQLQADRIITECIMDVMWWLKGDDVSPTDSTDVV